MTVSDLIRELQAMPPNAEVRIAMDTVVVLDELAGDYEVKIAQVEEAQPAYEVKYEGRFVGIYA